MDQAKHEGEWWHTAHILCSLTNLRITVAYLMAKNQPRDKEPKEFHPSYAGKGGGRGIPIDADNWADLKNLLPKGSKGRGD